MYRLQQHVPVPVSEPITAQKGAEEHIRSQLVRPGIKEMVYGYMTITVLQVLWVHIIKIVRFAEQL